MSVLYPADVFCVFLLYTWDVKRFRWYLPAVMFVHFVWRMSFQQFLSLGDVLHPFLEPSRQSGLFDGRLVNSRRELSRSDNCQKKSPTISTCGYAARHSTMTLRYGLGTPRTLLCATRGQPDVFLSESGQSVPDVPQTSSLRTRPSPLRRKPWARPIHDSRPI